MGGGVGGGVGGGEEGGATLLVTTGWRSLGSEVTSPWDLGWGVLGSVDRDKMAQHAQINWACLDSLFLGQFYKERNW